MRFRKAFMGSDRSSRYFSRSVIFCDSVMEGDRRTIAGVIEELTGVQPAVGYFDTDNRPLKGKKKGQRTLPGKDCPAAIAKYFIRPPGGCRPGSSPYIDGSPAKGLSGVVYITDGPGWRHLQENFGILSEDKSMPGRPCSVFEKPHYLAADLEARLGIVLLKKLRWDRYAERIL